MRFSIIVPIYNVETYLEKCIDSIISQTYNDFELILIDDGSTDKSYEICKKYEVKDKRIFLIHQTNKGSAATRNLGIKHSKGEYLIFIDSDDFWNTDKLLFNLNKIIVECSPDVILFGYNKFYAQSNKTKQVSKILKRTDIYNLKKEESFKLLFLKKIFISSAWTKVVKSKLIKDNKIFFREGILTEDIEWSALIAINMKTIDYLEMNPYNYTQRNNSISNSIKSKNIDDLISSIENCKIYSKTIENTEFYNPYMAYLSFQYITLLLNSTKIKLYKSQFMYIKNNKWLLKYCLGNIRIISFLGIIFPFNIFYNLIKFTFILKKRYLNGN